MKRENHNNLIKWGFCLISIFHGVWFPNLTSERPETFILESGRKSALLLQSSVPNVTNMQTILSPQHLGTPVSVRLPLRHMNLTRVGCRTTFLLNMATAVWDRASTDISVLNLKWFPAANQQWGGRTWGGPPGWVAMIEVSLGTRVGRVGAAPLGGKRFNLFRYFQL